MALEQNENAPDPASGRKNGAPYETPALFETFNEH
jgi:hypothetical protein